MMFRVHTYSAIFKIIWQNGLVYRLDLLLWRFRRLMATVLSLSVWSVVFANSASAFAYDRTTMITYVFLIAILQSFIFATLQHGLASRVYNGHLTYELLKPMNLYAYLFTQDIADKLKNVGLVILESVILFFIFKPVLVLPNAPTLLLFFVWLGLAILLHFFILLLFGSFGFWSPESWAVTFLFFMIVELTAGQLFPLDIMPAMIQKIINFTPFPYLSYYQTQLFLGRLSTAEMVEKTVILVFWCVVTAAVVHRIWQKGIKDYEATGR